MNEEKHIQIGEALRWALDASTDPAMASADWLAMDIDRSCSSAVAMLADASVSLSNLRKAKDAFKTMRVVGETSADRRLAARLYAASLAAALTRYGKRISRQSDQAMQRAFQSLLDDSKMPDELRDMAGKALCVLQEMP